MGILSRIALSNDLEKETSLVDSVVHHLQKMLNTRRGSVETAPDYGMPDLTEYAQSGDVRQELQKAILASIRLYEPRLQRVTITAVDADGLSARFDIHGALGSWRDGRTLRLETKLEASGRFSIKR